MRLVHETTESYALFNKTDGQGINTGQHNPIIQQSNSNPALDSLREISGFRREELPENSKREVGQGALNVSHNDTS